MYSAMTLSEGLRKEENGEKRGGGDDGVVAMVVATATATAVDGRRSTDDSGRHTVVTSKVSNPICAVQHGCLEPIFKLSRCGARASTSLPGMPDG